MFDITVARILAAAKEKWPDVDVNVSEPYWVDPTMNCVRVGVHLIGFDTAFGASFNYVTGKFE